MFKNISTCCLIAACAFAVFAAQGCRSAQPPGFSQSSSQPTYAPSYGNGSGTTSSGGSGTTSSGSGSR